MLKANLSELMYDIDRAIVAYENVLKYNPYSITALTQIASLCRSKEQHAKVNLILPIYFRL